MNTTGTVIGGYTNVASGNYSLAEGLGTITSEGATAGHAEGYQTFAGGKQGSHAEGYNTQALGY